LPGGPTFTQSGAAPTDDAHGFIELKRRWCDSFEREYLTSILVKTSGNVSAAARDAKLDRSNLLRLLRRHGLRAQDYRKGVEPATATPTTVVSDKIAA
jgi:transcriptional regulator of acetoin/glycerol metabolism